MRDKSAVDVEGDNTFHHINDAAIHSCKSRRERRSIKFFVIVKRFNRYIMPLISF